MFGVLLQAVIAFFSREPYAVLVIRPHKKRVAIQPRDVSAAIIDDAVKATLHRLVEDGTLRHDWTLQEREEHNINSQ